MFVVERGGPLKRQSSFGFGMLFNVSNDASWNECDIVFFGGLWNLLGTVWTTGGQNESFTQLALRFLPNSRESDWNCSMHLALNEPSAHFQGQKRLGGHYDSAVLNCWHIGSFYRRVCTRFEER